MSWRGETIGLTRKPSRKVRDGASLRGAGKNWEEMSSTCYLVLSHFRCSFLTVSVHTDNYLCISGKYKSWWGGESYLIPFDCQPYLKHVLQRLNKTFHLDRTQTVPSTALTSVQSCAIQGLCGKHHLCNAEQLKSFSPQLSLAHLWTGYTECCIKPVMIWLF